MKASFQLNFPIVNPVTGQHTWHNAMVGLEGLDMTADLILQIVQNTILIGGEQGGMASLLWLAEHLRIVSDNDQKEDNLQARRFDAPPATIMWGGYCGRSVIPGTDVMIGLNYDEGKVEVDCNEFTMRSIAGFSSNGINWSRHFKNAVNQAHERGLCRS